MKCVIVVLVLVLASLVASEPYQCSSQVTDKKGNVYQYDLTSLYHDPQLSDELYWMGDVGDLTYFNICGDTTTVCSPASPVCRRSGLWSTMGFGDLETQTFSLIEKAGVSPDRGITVKYTRGEWCPDSAGTSATIHIICSNSMKSVVTDLKIVNNNCSIEAVIESPAGCSKSISSDSSESSDSASSIFSEECGAQIVDKKGNVYQYNLSSLHHDPQVSDSLYFMDNNGALTYINLCGDTTTTCSPASPVCRRVGLWSTMGFGEVATQSFKRILLPDVTPDHGITVKYTQGEFCPNYPGTSSTIHIICSKEKNNITDVSLSDTGCILTAIIESPAGCGVLISSGSGSSDPGSSVFSYSSGASSESNSEGSSSSISLSLFLLCVFLFIMLFSSLHSFQ